MPKFLASSAFLEFGGDVNTRIYQGNNVDIT